MHHCVINLSKQMMSGARVHWCMCIMSDCESENTSSQLPYKLIACLITCANQCNGIPLGCVVLLYQSPE